MNKVLLVIFLLKNITDFFLLIVILHTGGPCVQIKSALYSTAYLFGGVKFCTLGEKMICLPNLRIAKWSQGIIGLQVPIHQN